MDGVDKAYSIAKQALSDDQRDSYRKMGEHLFSEKTNKIETGYSLEKEPEKEDILRYAVRGINSGLSAKDLTQSELQVLEEYYGKEWYVQFGMDGSNVPKSSINVVKKPKLSRQEIRRLQRYKRKNDF